MHSNRIIHSRDFIKRFKPKNFHICNKLKKKHHGGWQRALKSTPIHHTTVPVIISTNCRSLPNKILLSSGIHHNTGIVTLQETWLHDSYDDNIVSLNDFNVFRQARVCSKKKCGVGVVTFIHSKWSISNKVCLKFSNEYSDCITVRYRPKHLSKFKFIYISNVYVSPGCTKSDLSMFADEFTAFAAACFENSINSNW
uniref:Uncharacterized protein n=1 Tax=Trichobilharzia regenti TaxID=157069 RepID=A0AA85JMM9_TRIRE|nr:unnamed protein product [Trichobilharzia regenti]